MEFLVSELLLEIFSFCTLTELIKFRRVNKYWQGVINNRYDDSCLKFSIDRDLFDDTLLGAKIEDTNSTFVIEDDIFNLKNPSYVKHAIINVKEVSNDLKLFLDKFDQNDYRQNYECYGMNMKTFFLEIANDIFEINIPELRFYSVKIRKNEFKILKFLVQIYKLIS